LHSCFNPRHVKSPATTWVTTSFFVPVPYTLYYTPLRFLYTPSILYYLHTRLSHQNPLSLFKKVRGFLLILLFPLLVLTLILSLVVPLLTLLLKQELFIIVYLPFSLLILRYMIPHFLNSITTSIAFITFFLIILLLV